MDKHGDEDAVRPPAAKKKSREEEMLKVESGESVRGDMSV